MARQTFKDQKEADRMGERIAALEKSYGNGDTTPTDCFNALVAHYGYSPTMANRLVETWRHKHPSCGWGQLMTDGSILN